MGYQRKYYSHGTKPYVYNWAGQAMRPSMTHSGLGDDAPAIVVATPVVEDTSAQHPTDTTATAPVPPLAAPSACGTVCPVLLGVGLLGLWLMTRK
jgi:hypothetical protein